ncbi:hypothetical protein HH310_13785 [Actinoplanes sp. TBRC 11911]|uniref:hypothetical protein n=1 Tax=Actinoplanes sp. TBRC 11911 TaxID=2729386 RepID=UPI00145E1F85|nr:hypothetical protein [Actinoplanes sp. TBRC 11911]NMO52263.1 hypothetical protein [Actinoplanes sp. TBRC 11911]
MSDDRNGHQSHLTLYIVSGLVFLLLAFAGILTYRGAQKSQEADAKAAQLSLELSKAGLRVPTTDAIAGVLGDDGGAVCQDPGNALRRATLYGMLTNGAAGPGLRPIVADNNALRGQLAIMKVYCPQHLETLQQVANELKLAKTVRE